MYTCIKFGGGGRSIADRMVFDWFVGFHVIDGKQMREDQIIANFAIEKVIKCLKALNGKTFSKFCRFL